MSMFPLQWPSTVHKTPFPRYLTSSDCFIYYCFTTPDAQDYRIKMMYKISVMVLRVRWQHVPTAQTVIVVVELILYLVTILLVINFVLCCIHFIN